MLTQTFRQAAISAQCESLGGVSVSPIPFVAMGVKAMVLPKLRWSPTWAAYMH